MIRTSFGVAALILLAALGGCGTSAGAEDRAAAPTPAAPTPEERTASTASTPAHHWGRVVDGLRMRVSAPARVRQGDFVRVGVETDVVTDALPSDVRTIDARGAWYFARLVVTSPDRGEIVVRCVDPTGGLPDPPGPPGAEGLRSADGYLLQSLTGAAPVPRRSPESPVAGGVTFPLAVAWGRIVPGEYEAYVEVAVDETAYSHPAQGDWRGTLRSAPFALVVEPAPTTSFTIEVPLTSLGGEGDGTAVVRVEVRNGFAVGCPLGSGPPDGEMAERISASALRSTKPWVLFESSARPGHRRRLSPRDEYARVLLRLEPPAPPAAE